MTSKGEPAAQPVKPKDKGTVKSVLSGDTIVVLDDKPAVNGPPAEKIITLSSLQAPRMAGKNNEKDEDWAFESREFLRKKVVGKKIQYQIDHSTPTGRDYVTAYLAPVAGGAPECVNHSVVAEGWANVKESSKKGDQQTTLATLEDTAKQAGKGIHAKDKPKPLSKNDEDADTLFRQLKGKPLNAIIEQVRTGTSVRVTLLPTRHTFQVLLSGAQSKGWKKVAGQQEPQPEPYSREAKYFIESKVLQRDVNLTIESIAPPAPNQDKNQIVFSGSIEYQGRDVAEELLKEGLATYVAFSAAPRGAEWVAKLKAAEKEAKDAKRRLFADYVDKSGSNGGKSIGKEFVARVVNIQNSGTIIVIPEGATAELSLSLSSIFVPRPPLEEAKKAKQREAAKQQQEGGEKKEEKDDGKKRLKEIADAHWAAEGKEMLRKRLIGQKVRVVHDYTKQSKEKTLPEKAYYSVYQNDQNLAVVLVESGLAEVNNYTAAEDRPADFEVLLMAEKKAKEAHRGIHSPVEKVPARRYNDLAADEDSETRFRRASTFLSSLERAGPQKAVVEHVFSGARFKLTVPKQSVVLFFTLAGISVPKRGESENSEDSKLSNAAMLFSREKLQQLEVTVDFTGVDKGGNFIGNLQLNKKNFAVTLVENGLAKVHYFSAERLKGDVGTELANAEKIAKSKKLGVWKNYDEEAEKAKLESDKAAAEGESKASAAGRTFEAIITEVIDGARFYYQEVGAESAGLEELVTQLTELSVQEGTGIPLLTPKVGEEVRGHFTADDRWYRAKVLEVKGDKYKLQYVDYGNSEVVPASRIRSLPPNSNTLPHQAKLATLAFVKPLKEDNESFAEAKDELRHWIEGRKLNATLEYKDGNVSHLTLLDGSSNIAGKLVEQGLARLVHRVKRNYSNPTYVALKDAEAESKRRRLGIWYYGDLPDSDEDEKDSAPKRGAGGKAAAAGKDAKGAPAAAAAEKGGKKK